MIFKIIRSLNIFKKRVAADYIVKRAFVAQGGISTSTDSNELKHPNDTSIIVVKDDGDIFDSLCPMDK